MTRPETSAAIFGGGSRKLLHVLTLTPFYPTLRDDAYGCFVAEPITSLNALGVTSTVFAAQPFYRERESANPQAPAAEFVRYPSLPGGMGLSTSGSLLSAWISKRGERLHKLEPFDLIHAHGPLPCGHAAMLLGQKLGIPYVVSVHGLDAYGDVQARGGFGRLARSTSLKVFHNAQRVICISEHVRKQVLAGDEGLRTSIVYNGADPALFSPSEAVEQPIVLSVGNLIPIKGHAILLNALGQIKAKHPGVRCEIVGTGPLREKLAALAAKLDVNVNFRGRIGRSELAEAYRRCAVFALPSYYEGLGCVYLEAMASGKATVGCWRQGIEEIIKHKHNGWLVSPNDPEDLAAGLSALLSDASLRNNIAEEGRRTVLKGFTLSRQAEGLDAIYREIVQ